MRFPTAPDKPVPHLDVNADMGGFVYAVSKLPPGKSYMAEGTTCSWSEYMRLWSEVTGKPARYQQITLQQMIDESPDKEFGREVGDMFLYSSEPGYDGGDESLLKAEDIRKVRFPNYLEKTLLIHISQARCGMSYDISERLDEATRLVRCYICVICQNYTVSLKRSASWELPNSSLHFRSKQAKCIFF